MQELSRVSSILESINLKASNNQTENVQTDRKVKQNPKILENSKVNFSSTPVLSRYYNNKINNTKDIVKSDKNILNSTTSNNTSTFCKENADLNNNNKNLSFNAETVESDHQIKNKRRKKYQIVHIF